MTDKFFITTAISYTNGDPHIGHAYESILADFIARFNRVLGKNVHFLTGTDEHGLKIEKTAQSKSITPKQLCDIYADKFKQLDRDLNISFDKFIRTTDEKHLNTVKSFYEKCKDDIYLGKYSGWYDVKEESFVSEFEAKRNNYLSPTSGIAYTRVDENSYFFKLGKYKDQILKHIEDNPDFIVPSSARNSILDRLTKLSANDGGEKLNDLSISRTSIEWGIPIPNDDSHVMYVWFDALVNYISGSDHNWPPNVQIIGKDILWFHAVVWVGMLLSAGLELPKQIFVHNFVCDSEGKKMSKSLGNVVDPNQLISEYPVDIVRYYLLTDSTLSGDVNFNLESLIACNDTILLANLGNYINRVFGLFHKYCNSKIPSCCVVESLIFGDKLTELCNNLEACVSRCKPNKYIRYVSEYLADLNKYVNDTKVWEIHATYSNDERCEDDRQRIIKTLLESVYCLAHFYEPLIPTISSRIVKDFLQTNLTTFRNLNGNNLKSGIYIKKENTLLFEIIDKTSYEKRRQKNMNKNN